MALKMSIRNTDTSVKGLERTRPLSDNGEGCEGVSNA